MSPQHKEIPRTNQTYKKGNAQLTKRQPDIEIQEKSKKCLNLDFVTALAQGLQQRWETWPERPTDDNLLKAQWATKSEQWSVMISGDQCVGMGCEHVGCKNSNKQRELPRHVYWERVSSNCGQVPSRSLRLHQVQVQVCLIRLMTPPTLPALYKPDLFPPRIFYSLIIRSWNCQLLQFAQYQVLHEIFWEYESVSAS